MGTGAPTAGLLQWPRGFVLEAFLLSTCRPVPGVLHCVHGNDIVLNKRFEECRVHGGVDVRQVQGWLKLATATLQLMRA